MIKFVRTAVLSALVALGAIGATSAPAMVGGGSIYLGFGSAHGGVGCHFTDRGHHDYRDRGRHGGYHRGYCSPREAVRKASRMGLRHARVVSSSPRTVRVEGRRHGPRYHVVSFANARNCPVLR